MIEGYKTIGRRHYTIGEINLTAQLNLNDLLNATETAMQSPLALESSAELVASIQQCFQGLDAQAFLFNCTAQDITALHRLGVACRLSGQFAMSERFYERAYQLACSVKGPNSMEAAKQRNFLAGLYFAWSRYPESLALIEESYRYYQSVLGDSHIHTSLTAFAAALAASACGKSADSHSYYEHSALRNAMSATASLDFDRWTALTMKLAGLAALKYEQGQLEESCDLFRFCVLREAQEAWPQTMAVANELNKLALLCRSQRLDDEALEFFKMTMQLKETLVGTEHEEYKRTRTQYDALLRSRVKFTS